MSARKKAVIVEAKALKWLVDGLLPAAAKNDVAPILNTVHFVVADGVLRGVSSDRYRVHTATIQADGSVPAQSFTVTRELVVWLSRNAGAFNTRGRSPLTPVVKIEVVPDESVTFTILRDLDAPQDRVSRSGDMVVGKYPPVLGLIEKAREAEDGAPLVRLNMQYIGDTRKLATHPGDSPRVRFTAGAADKPGPVHIAYGPVGATLAEALVMPNLLL